MSQDKRKYPRRPVVLDIELSYPSGETTIVQSRDISEGGLFLVMDNKHKPVIGELIGIKLSGESTQQETLPSGEAVVVHLANDGIGVAFIEMDFEEDV